MSSTETLEIDPEVAKNYVVSRLRNKGGFPELWQALCRKTLPFWFGLESQFSLNSIFRLILRVIVWFASVITPFLLRKLTDPSAPTGSDGSRLMWAISRIDKIDIALGLVVGLLPVIVKYLDMSAKEKVTIHKLHAPAVELCSALDKMPNFVAPPSERRARSPDDETLRFALCALQAELSYLIGDNESKQVVDVTFLEYCNAAGSQMQVRVRTAAHEEIRRPIRSEKFMAHYVAKTGRWFVEHDFLKGKNPFPKYRLSVLGSHKITYRSVLFLPVTITDRVNESGENVQEQRSVDYCIGVICAHTAKPYRFWRMGDHKKEMAGFGNVAYQRSLPYIVLVRRLLQQTAHRVPLEER